MNPSNSLSNSLSNPLASSNPLSSLNSLFSNSIADFKCLLETNDAAFKDQLALIFASLSKSRKHSARHIAEYSSIYSEYISNVSTTQEALRNTIIDQTTVKNLQSQIKRATDLVSASSQREDFLKEELRTIKSDISSLNTTLKQGVGLSSLQEKTINDLFQQKEDATRELAAELEKINTLRSHLSDIAEKIRSTDESKRQIEQDIYDYKDKNLQKKQDIDSELRNKERLERDLRDLRVVVAVKIQEVKTKQDSQNRVSQDIGFLESQIKAHKSLLEKLLKDQETLVGRTNKLQIDCNQQLRVTNAVIEQNDALAKDLRTHEHELARIKHEIRKMAKMRAALVAKNRQIEQDRAALESKKTALKEKLECVQADIQTAKRALEGEKKMLDEHRREHALLAQNVGKTGDAAQRHIDLALVLKQTRRNIEIEIQRFTRESAVQFARIERLEKERGGLLAEIEKTHEQCVAVLAQLKAVEVDVFEGKKRLVQGEMKLRHQQNMHEQIVTDRNLHSKHLIESQAEIAGMKRALRIMHFQISGFKEDIQQKYDAVRKGHAEQQRLQRDIETINEEIKSLRAQNALAQEYVRTQLGEQVKLEQFVKEAEIEKTRQENALQALVNERDSLGMKLIAQNTELRKVYDAIKTSQFAISRSERHFWTRCSEIARLKAGVLSRMRELAALDGETAAHAERRAAVGRLEKELSVEQARLTALEEELRNPVNIHRWRTMEGSNPKAYEMIQIVMSLKRKLVSRTREERAKAHEVRAMEQMYLALRGEVARQLGPEAHEQVAEYVLALKEKKRQLRHMDAELNMYTAQVREHKHAIAQVEKRIAEIRTAYVAKCK